MSIFMFILLVSVCFLNVVLVLYLFKSLYFGEQVLKQRISFIRHHKKYTDSFLKIFFISICLTIYIYYQEGFFVKESLLFFIYVFLSLCFSGVVFLLRFIWTCVHDVKKYTTLSKITLVLFFITFCYQSIFILSLF